MFTVTGKVTFQDEPVDQGGITFEDPESGIAVMGDLGEGGQYTLEVPPGTYQIGITPPLEDKTGRGDTPDDADYAKVDNIPPKYHWGGESGLTATVSDSETKHDFNMTP